MVDAEIAGGISPERIVLAGFSQGGVVVLQAGLRYQQKLAGIIALSTYLPLEDSLESEKAWRPLPVTPASRSESRAWLRHHEQ